MRSARAAWPASTASPSLKDVVAGDVEDRRSRSARSRARPADRAARASGFPGARRAGCLRRGRRRRRARAGPSSPAATCWPCAASRCAIHCGSALRSTGSTRTVTPAPSSAVNQALDLLRAVEPRQLDQRDHVASAAGDRDLAVALQRLRAVLAGLARRDADLDQLAVGEQAQRLRRAEQAAPVEVRTGDGVHLALAAAGGARRGADRVGRFLRQQRLVAPDGVDGAQLALQVRGEAIGGAAACGIRGCTEASRRSTCETMSLCIVAVQERLFLLLGRARRSRCRSARGCCRISLSGIRSLPPALRTRKLKRRRNSNSRTWFGGGLGDDDLLARLGERLQHDLRVLGRLDDARRRAGVDVASQLGGERRARRETGRAGSSGSAARGRA